MFNFALSRRREEPVLLGPSAISMDQLNSARPGCTAGVLLVIQSPGITDTSTERHGCFQTAGKFTGTRIAASRIDHVYVDGRICYRTVLRISNRTVDLRIHFSFPFK